MTERSTGLILRVRPLTDTSLIVHWLTPGHGRIATVAKGARRSKSPFRGKLDLFFLADFSFHRSRSSDLHALREVSVCRTHPALRCDMARLEQAAYAARLIEQVTETETPVPEIYHLFLGMLEFLQEHPAMTRALAVFELKLLRELGLGPDVSGLEPEVRELVAALVRCDWGEIGGLTPTAEQARELLRFLRGSLIFHLGKVPTRRPV